MQFLYASVITVLTVLLMFVAGALVGRARGKFDIKAPATTGHPEFERTFRAQMNTLEATAMFLPLLWIVSVNGYDLVAGVLGVVWLLGRCWYLVAYINEASKRGSGMMLSVLAWLGLLLMCGWVFFRLLLV